MHPNEATPCLESKQKHCIASGRQRGGAKIVKLEINKEKPLKLIQNYSEVGP